MGSNPSIIKYMDIFNINWLQPLYCWLLKRPKINEKDAGMGRRDGLRGDLCSRGREFESQHEIPHLLECNICTWA